MRTVKQMMSSRILIGIVVLCGAVGVGYWLGQRSERRASAQRVERLQTENISNVVGAIYLLDSVDVPGTRRALLGLASGSLDGVIENWNGVENLHAEYRESQCSVLTRLRNLRVKHNFLGNPEDQMLRLDPVIAEAEKRRRTFLESIHCHSPPASAQ